MNKKNETLADPSVVATWPGADGFQSGPADHSSAAAAGLGQRGRRSGRHAAVCKWREIIDSPSWKAVEG